MYTPYHEAEKKRKYEIKERKGGNQAFS